MILYDTIEIKINSSRFTTNSQTMFLLEAPKGVTSLATITKAMSAVGVIGGGGSGMMSREVRRYHRLTVTWLTVYVRRTVNVATSTPDRCTHGTPWCVGIVG